MKLIKRAEQIAREAHKGQTRWDKTPYIKHPMRVAKSLNGDDCKVVAWLHDVLEDTPRTAQDLVNKGVPVRLVNSVKNLTRVDEENYYDFIMRIGKDSLAARVKIADIEDNLNDNLKEGTLKDKYMLARYILYHVLYHQFLMEAMNDTK